MPPLVERRSSMSVRAYDAAGLLVDADVVIGRDVGKRAEAMLGAGADFVHVHNARPGCFMCTIRAGRAGAALASAG